MPKKERKRRFKPSLKKRNEAQFIATQSIPEDPVQLPKKYSPLWYLGHFALSVAWLWLTVYGGNMLSDIYSIGGFLFTLVCLCLLVGYWTWILIGHFFSSKKVKGSSALIMVITTIFIAQFFMGYLIRNQGTIEMPLYVDDSDVIKVHYGNKENEFMWAQKSIGELKREPYTAFNINGQDIFYIHIKDNRLLVDTLLFTGVADSVRHIYYPPVEIKDTGFMGKPEGWEIRQNSTTLEISTGEGVPVFILKYNSAYDITIWGLFPTPMGILKVDNTEGTVFLLGDTLEELGEYKVDRVFIDSIFDIFNPERTYRLMGVRQ